MGQHGFAPWICNRASTGPGRSAARLSDRYIPPWDTYASIAASARRHLHWIGLVFLVNVLGVSQDSKMQYKNG